MMLRMVQASVLWQSSEHVYAIVQTPMSTGTNLSRRRRTDCSGPARSWCSWPTTFSLRGDCPACPAAALQSLSHTLDCACLCNITSVITGCGMRELRQRLGERRH